MDVTQTQTLATRAAAADTDSKASINADFDTFLKMMTTQLQNQDPLNPVDSADYAVQLATFSGVEQQTRTNKLLESIQSEFGLMGMAQLASWVGKEARSIAPIWVDGQPVNMTLAPAAGADRSVLVVYDGQGKLISREDVPLSSASIDWAPTDAAGAPLPAGTYSFKLESYADDKLISSNGVETYGKIVEVRGGTGGTTLLLEGGSEVAAASVTALRDG
jgi:flagellar basal-body rod modification protein FlgD